MTEVLDELSLETGKAKKHLDILYWLRFRSITYDFDLLILNASISQKYHVAKESHFILMKSTFFQIFV